MPASLTDTVGKICFLVKVKISTSGQLNLTFNHCIPIFLIKQINRTDIPVLLVIKRTIVLQ